MTAEDTGRAQAWIAEHRLDEVDCSSTLRSAVAEFAQVRGYLPQCKSSDALEKTLASGIRVARALRWGHTFSYRKGVLTDFHLQLSDSMMNEWEQATSLGVFFWWPTHAVWFEEAKAVLAATGELPKLGAASRHAALARQLRRVHQRRFASGRQQMRVTERGAWERALPGIWRLEHHKEDYIPAKHIVDAGGLVFYGTNGLR